VRRGLSLISNLPDSDSVWHQQQELDLLIPLGQALRATHGGGAPVVGETFARAHELCVSLNLRHQLLPILFGQWEHHLIRGDLKRAQQLAGDLLQLGETRNDVVLLVTGCLTSGVACLYAGDFVDAAQNLEHGVALFDPSQRPWYEVLGTDDTFVNLLTMFSHALVYVGRLDKARSRSRAAVAEARRLSNPASLIFALQSGLDVGWAARWDPDELLQHANEALALSTEHGFALWWAQAAALRGWCLTAQGHSGDGIPLLTNALTQWLATGASIGVAQLHILLADAYRISGQPHAGFAHLTEAERLAEEGRDLTVLAETLRLRGDLLMLTDDRLGAEASLRAAVAVAQRQNAKLWEIRSATSLARLWRDQGKRADARDLLAPIYGWFTEGFEAPDLKDAKALLDELT
jgi:tetratricopeptide (TPR) repeat protein